MALYRAILIFVWQRGMGSVQKKQRQCSCYMLGERRQTGHSITVVPIKKTLDEPYVFTKMYTFTGLEPNTTYQYELKTLGKPQVKAQQVSGTFNNG